MIRRRKKHATPGCNPDTFEERLRSGSASPGEIGQFLHLDIQPTSIPNLRTALASTFGVPVLLHVAGDGVTPTIGPALTLTGAIGTTPSPYQLSTGADIPMDVYDGNDCLQQTAGNLDPGANDVVIAGVVQFPNDVVNSKLLYTHRAAARGYQLRTVNNLFSVIIQGDASTSPSFTALANALTFFCLIIDRNGSIYLFCGNKLQASSACPAGDIFAGVKTTIGATSTLTQKWPGKILWIAEWQGASIADTWIANDYTYVRSLLRLVTGLTPVLSVSATLPKFRRSTGSPWVATQWTDHHGTVWPCSPSLPRSGNSLGLQIDVDGGGGVPAEALFAPDYCVGVSGTYTRIQGWRNRSNRVTAAMLTPPTNVIVLAGQSNARGSLHYVADLPAAYALPRSDASAYYWLGPDGTTGAPYYSSYLEPLYAPNGMAGLETSAVGMEPTLAVNLLTAGMRTTIVKIVEGATTLAVDWQPGTNRRAALDTLPSYVGGKTMASITCVIWWQGETDAANAVQAAAYEANLTALILAWRAIYGPVPWFIVRLPIFSPIAFAAVVRAAQDAVIVALPDVYLVDTDAVAFQADNIHCNDLGYQTIGQNVAVQVLAL